MKEEFNERRRNQKNNKNSLASTLLLIVSILIFCTCLFILVRWYINTSSSKKKYDDLANDVVKNIDDNGNQDDNNGSDYIDFDKLENINKDVVGWIKVENTSINYPILQSNNNDVYLTSDIYGNYDSCGAIFLDYRNSSKFEDKNSMIYGHNIKLGTMFSDVVNIYNGNLGMDVTIDIYTREKKTTYRVFSSYMMDASEDALPISFLSSEAFNDFINSTINRSSINYVRNNVMYESNMITVSTCNSDGKKRIIVHAYKEN